MEHQGSAQVLRRLVAGLVLLGALGLAIELLLLEHFDSFLQWMPLVSLGGALVTTTAVALRPTSWSLWLHRLVMGLTAATGVAGLYLHYGGNAALEREIEPGVEGLALAWNALRGAVPTMAPGAMIQLGLLGLIQTWRHPALGRREVPPGAAPSARTPAQPSTRE